MAFDEDEIYKSIRFNHEDDRVALPKWPKLSCSAANELTLATQDDSNPGFARLAIAGELKLQAGVAVNELSSDGKLTNNSDLAIPTQKAVKTYVDNQIAVVNKIKAALNGAASQDFQSQNLSVSGNLTANGNVSIGTTSSSYKLAIASGDINIDDSRALRQAGRWVIGGDSNVLSIGSSNAPDGRDIRFDPGFSGALTVKKDTGNVGIGTTTPQGKLDVRGDIRAGNSDIYFTKTDHEHTGVGNTPGFAAIENSKSYEALMILGRAGTSKGRYVRLWDYLQVNGGMDVTGGAILNGLAVGVDPPGNINPLWPYETISTIYPDHNLRLHSNQGIYFHVANRADGSFGVNANGTWHGSSRETKEDFADLSSEEASETLKGLNPIKFVFKEDESKKLHIGFIAEEVPDIISSPDKKMVSYMDVVALLTKVVKEQQQTISALAEKVKVLEEQNQLQQRS